MTTQKCREGFCKSNDRFLGIRISPDRLSNPNRSLPNFQSIVTSFEPFATFWGSNSIAPRASVLLNARFNTRQKPRSPTLRLLSLCTTAFLSDLSPSR
ncbi:MAG: hypothetical protein QOK06_3017 [Acidimicrobiaceae bacterium]